MVVIREMLRHRYRPLGGTILHCSRVWLVGDDALNRAWSTAREGSTIAVYWQLFSMLQWMFVYQNRESVMMIASVA